MKNLFLFCCILFACCAQRDISNDTVYVTGSGNKYHLQSCRYLGDHAVPIALKDAVSNGYELCTDCYPPAYKLPATTPATGSSMQTDSSPGQRSAPVLSVRCTAKTKRGTRCKRMTMDPSGRCFQHQQ